jgi:YedE family putative selenium metabolism protein|uniref:YedE-related selenium metabolism membrane protein n=1 Tax=Desulfobacca acetoxidans TaxID=60893 RepID=A0A7V6A366_9BACT
MSAIKEFFASRTGIISVGAFIGILAALLQKWGNPGNMGICVACFERDIAGAIGLHRAAVVQYLRPEILGFVLGAFLSAYIFKEYHARAGSAPIVRFILGMIAMIGALVFLGCPWRALLRLAGGDGNAIFGTLGLAAGIGIGALFFKSGYNLGRTQKTYPSVGWLLPLIIFGLLILRFMYPQIPGQDTSGILFYSLKGPGSMYAPLVVSLVAGLVIGVVAQRSRFCTMGAFRDLFLFRHMHLLSGVVALLAAAFLTNLLLGQFHPGFVGQPVAHTMEVWNFLGMTVAGLAFALAGGCPGRQLFMTGEGDGDAALFAIGMVGGAAVSHNFGLASTPAGVGPNGVVAVILCFIVLLLIGFTMRQKA